MTFFLLFLLISVPLLINCKPKPIFSLHNDPHDPIRQLFHTNCSILNQHSDLFICSNEIYSYMKFHLDLFLVPYQSNFNRCAIVFKYRQIFEDNQSFLHYFKHQSILSIDKNDLNRSLIITIGNSLQNMNYCTFRLSLIGLDCSLVQNPIDLYNISCVLNMKLWKFERMNTNQQYLVKKINQNGEQMKSHQHLLALFITMFLLTIIPLLILIYNEQIRTASSNYRKYDDRSSSSSVE